VIWLVSSITILVFLFINTTLEIYGLGAKNFCLVLSCGLSRLCLIALGNLAVIILAFIVSAMKEDQLTYICVGAPICLYNFMKAITLFKAAHRIRQKEKEERDFKRQLHYNRQISIPHPDFQQDVKVDQFVNPHMYPYQTVNTATYAMNQYNQQQSQYNQLQPMYQQNVQYPTLYPVPVPQSNEFTDFYVALK